VLLGPVAQPGWSVRLIEGLGKMPMIDLQSLIPQRTSRGDPITYRVEGDYITVCYERARGRPKPIKIRRSVDRELFIAGVTIWACEGTRKRPYELEVTNSSSVIAKTFIKLLKELGLGESVKLRLHATPSEYERLKRYWRNILGIDAFSTPIITESRGSKDIGNGIIHIKVYSAVLRELFNYWAEALPQLL